MINCENCGICKKRKMKDGKFFSFHANQSQLIPAQFLVVSIFTKSQKSTKTFYWWSKTGFSLKISFGLCFSNQAFRCSDVNDFNINFSLDQNALFWNSGLSCICIVDWYHFQMLRIFVLLRSKWKSTLDLIFV